MRCGKPAETPAAIIEQGTTRDQKVVVGTISDLARKAGEARVRAPAVLVIGDVVSLRKTLQQDT
jgi:siroheme synthase